MPRPAVPPMQIVLRGADRSSAEVDLVDNPAGTHPSAFENLAEGVRVPRLGGKALARLADLASEQGYRIVRYEILADGGRIITDEQLEDEISSQLLEAERAGGSSAVLGLLAHDLLDWEIGGVELLSSATGVFTVRRNGVVFTKAREATEDLLRRNWQEVTS